ncbi:MAG: c-type cytochrome [Chitinophagales bacterium]|nr:c-type cytochrome [Chitinophagales bacterium]
MRQVRLIILLCIPFVTLFSASCSKKENKVTGVVMSSSDVPAWFPAIPFPEENQYSTEKWELGKQLFYDKRLSRDNTISCASCHKADIAFSDNIAKSIGVGGLPGRQNAPTLANVAYQPYYTRAGGVATLEMQILVPIQEHDEFDFNIVDIATLLNEIPEYVQMSREAFDRDPDPYVITRAIATFERTMVSGNSPYDKYEHRGDRRGVSDAAVRGMKLFFSTRTNCSSCHSGFNFTDYSFKNNGLYTEYADPGRQRLTGKAEDNALFKVPTLRNIALTAPYMHDGSLNSLEEVVKHYNSGGRPHLNKSPLIQPLGLTMQEQKDLIAFLNTLTDVEFINNKKHYYENK